MAYTIDPNVALGNPHRAAANLTRAQWQLFYNRYRPLENDISGLLLRDIEPEAQRAGFQVNRAFDNATGIAERMRARYGLTQTEMDKRRTGLERALATAAAENAVRADFKDKQLQGLGQMLSIGKGISGSAGSALSDASSLQAQREAAGRQAAAAKKAQTMQTIGTIAGLGLAAAALF